MTNSTRTTTSWTTAMKVLTKTKKTTTTIKRTRVVVLLNRNGYVTIRAWHVCHLLIKANWNVTVLSFRQKVKVVLKDKYNSCNIIVVTVEVGTVLKVVSFLLIRDNNFLQLLFFLEVSVKKQQESGPESKSYSSENQNKLREKHFFM